MQLERTTISTLLGIRFWDAVQNTQVRDNLTATAQAVFTTSPPASPDAITVSPSVTTAFRTVSGIYAFQGLTGIRDIEHPAPSSTSVSSPLSSTDKRQFLIEVKDNQRRFLPTVFGVELPLDYRGVFGNGMPSAIGSSPPETSPPRHRPASFLLFSAPTRSSGPGVAAVRGCLVDASRIDPHTQRAAPAAHAVLEVEVNSRRWYGVADEGGSIAVLFPYPTFLNTPGLSPPDTLQLFPLKQQQWRLTIRVRFSPETLDFPLGPKHPPDLRTVINQSPGVIWQTHPQSPIAASPVDAWSLNLRFGQDLVLQTANLPPTEPWKLPGNELWIDRGTSPP